MTEDMVDAHTLRRWFSKVDVRGADECWPWTGAKNPKGYGNMTVKSVHTRAHRFSYVAFNGDISQELLIRHTCDNPPCVNPNHLLVGTYVDNAADAKARGLLRGGGVRGVRNFNAKLNPDKVRKIREMAASGMRQKDIGKAFGVAQTTICSVLKRQTWAYVE